MKRITIGALLFLLWGSAIRLVNARRDAEPRSQAKSATPSNDQERLLAIGRRVFVQRCAKCHDERGNKPLKTGPPLSERKLADDEIARMVSGRLKSASEEERRAVALYISSFMKKD
jgi:mono/diheme cytochrome c family protein